MLFVITDPTIRSAKPRLCQTFTENAVISSPKHFCQILKCAKSARRDVWRMLPRLRPGPSISLASTAAPLLSNSSAAATWPLRAAQCSGVMPQAAFSRNAVGSWALCPFNQQTNDECFGLNTFKLCKAKYVHTQTQTQRTSFNTSGFRQITFNETKSIIL